MVVDSLFELATQYGIVGAIALYLVWWVTNRVAVALQNIVDTQKQMAMMLNHVSDNMERISRTQEEILLMLKDKRVDG
ncbi:MAG: hypothetical protein GXO68_05805 [Crenarchaeota archaeon]|nr:hypothetical protein [Thermoproteota archaeon]